MRRSLDQLYADLQECYRQVPKESFFRHQASGKVYEVILLSIREDDNAVLVTYSDGLVTFTRPFDEFVGLVDSPNGPIQRFVHQGGRLPHG